MTASLGWFLQSIRKRSPSGLLSCSFYRPSALSPIHSATAVNIFPDFLLHLSLPGVCTRCQGTHPRPTRKPHILDSPGLTGSGDSILRWGEILVAQNSPSCV